MENLLARSAVEKCSSASRRISETHAPDHDHAHDPFETRQTRIRSTIKSMSMTSISSDAPDVEVSIEIEHSTLYNKDLAPVPKARRTWRVGSFAALWISMSACIPTYMLASSLIGGGMNWSQAILTIFLGNLIVVVPMILNAHAGTKYGIPDRKSTRLNSSH